jgi:Bacterial dnaA protein helix-turn-helix
MASVQLREFTSGAEMMAHYAQLRAKRLAVVAPVTAPVEKPIQMPTIKPWELSRLRKFRRSIIELQPDESFPHPPLGPRSPGYEITVSDVLQAVCREFDMKRIDLMSARRTANIVLPRQVVMYLAKTLTPFSLPHIGRRLGGKDHTTVLHAVRKIEKRRQTDTVLNCKLLALEAELRPPPPITDDPNQLALPLAGEAG